MTGCRKNKAFTLIELLVVISIIALLLSILVPSLAKVKKQAVAVICTTRVKDIGNALGMYASDYPDRIPPSTYTTPAEAQQYAAADIDVIWVSRIASYYDKKNARATLSEKAYGMLSFRCPTQEYYLKMLHQRDAGQTGPFASPKTGQSISLWEGAGAFGLNVYFSGVWAYDQNGNPTGDDTFNYRRTTDIKNASSVPMVGDMAAEPYYGYEGNIDAAIMPPPSEAGGWIMWPHDPHPIYANYGWENGVSSAGPAALHDGKIPYLFADGHAESRKGWPWDDLEDYKGVDDRMHYFHPHGTDEYYP